MRYRLFVPTLSYLPDDFLIWAWHKWPDNQSVGGAKWNIFMDASYWKYVRKHQDREEDWSNL